MSQFHFGVGRGAIPAKLAKQVDAIAQKHGADFTNVKLPGEGYRYWFSCRNYGAPFDGATAKAVMADLEAAGIDLAAIAAKHTRRFRHA